MGVCRGEKVVGVVKILEKRKLLLERERVGGGKGVKRGRGIEKVATCCWSCSSSSPLSTTACTPGIESSESAQREKESARARESEPEHEKSEKSAASCRDSIASHTSSQVQPRSTLSSLTPAPLDPRP